MGSTTAKISRHEPSWSSSPDTAGPSAGATDMTRVTLPITLPRSCGGTSVIIVVISSGIITAVPLAWTTRAASRTLKVGRQGRERGAGEEQPHRQRVGRAGGDPLEEPAGGRDDDGHREHERGGQPLGARGGDGEVAHQPRDRVDHDRLVEDDDERRQGQDPHHEVDVHLGAAASFARSAGLSSVRIAVSLMGSPLVFRGARKVHSRVLTPLRTRTHRDRSPARDGHAPPPPPRGAKSLGGPSGGYAVRVRRRRSAPGRGPGPWRPRSRGPWAARSW